MKKFLKWAAIALVLIVGISFIGFYMWSSVTYKVSDELLELVVLENYMDDDAYIFEPEADDDKTVGIILYPGAKVEPEAYGFYAQNLMEQGYTVIVPNMLFNFALFSSSKAADYFERYPEIEHWIVGGHSLGGVAAAMYAAEQDVDGLLFLGSYPSDSSDLSDVAFPVLSLSAQFDGLTLREDIENTKPLLPTHTVFEEIKGGNHAQFGMYGEQKGDGKATITATEQQEQMIKLTLEWLEENNM